MSQRKYNKTKIESIKQTKRITLPIDLAAYNELLHDKQAFRHCLNEMIQYYPELFPSDIAQGYKLHGMLPASRKMPHVQLRRIQLAARDLAGERQLFTIAPCDILPYMAGEVTEVEKALFLRRFGVPFWALTYVFGHNDMYWYRIVGSLGRHDIVGTTVKEPEKLPEHLLADEKHAYFNGAKVYIATTVAQDCVLGASVSCTADAQGLTEAYGHFQQEAHRLDAHYAPTTVNTDGWQATHLAWQQLFATVTIIQCFLHAFLKVRTCGKRLGSTFTEIKSQVWDIYRATSRPDFRQKVSQLQDWTRSHADQLTNPVIEAIDKLCAKADSFMLSFDYPEAHRTSNMVDRHMEPMARWLYSTRYFHGHYRSAELHTRSWALLHNFWPYCPRAKVRETYQSPAHKLNGFVYRDNWLENLLVSTSLQGFHVSNKKR
jgi:hypothetical protein